MGVLGVPVPALQASNVIWVPVGVWLACAGSGLIAVAQVPGCPAALPVRHPPSNPARNGRGTSGGEVQEWSVALRSGYILAWL